MTKSSFPLLPVLLAATIGCSEKELVAADSASGGGSGGSQAGGVAIGGSPAGGERTGGSPTSGGGTGIGGFGGVTQLSRVAADALAHCAISTTGDPQTDAMDVPLSLTGPQWGLLDIVCHDGGFDLSLCAGRTVELTSILTNQIPPGSSTDTPYTARVLALGDQLCCVYKSYDATPGLDAATCGPAYPALAAMSRCSIFPHSLDDQQTVEEVTVPSSLPQDPLWDARDALCAGGGYDLSRCAGNQATLVTVLESTTLAGNPEPIKAWILTLGDTVCCIWETDGASAPNLRARSCTL